MNIFFSRDEADRMISRGTVEAKRLIKKHNELDENAAVVLAFEQDKELSKVFDMIYNGTHTKQKFGRYVFEETLKSIKDYRRFEAMVKRLKAQAIIDKSKAEAQQ